ncbi:hypothetical protein QFZ96_002379 [Paraburkholderia youngii]
MVQLVAGFFQLAESVEMAAGLGFYPADRNRLVDCVIEMALVEFAAMDRRTSI